MKKKRPPIKRLPNKPPIPKHRAGAHYAEAVSNMEIGDCMIASDRKVANAVYIAARRIGLGITQRQQEDGSVKLWRVK